MNHTYGYVIAKSFQKKDALEEIERAKKNIEYIESQKDYKGQSPWQCAVSLAGMLEYWN